MKCYHCNQNEANYRFFINTMGHVLEIDLCESCAAIIRRQTGMLFSELLSRWAPYLKWPDNPSPGRFPPRRPAPEPLGDRTMPPPEEIPSTPPFPDDAGTPVRLRRKLGELRARLQEAVDREDYESAALLRDEIIKTEKDVCTYDA